MLYCSRADLYDATIEPVEVPPGSAKPWVFKLQPRLRDGSELQATEFAVPTKDMASASGVGCVENGGTWTVCGSSRGGIARRHDHRLQRPTA